MCYELDEWGEFIIKGIEGLGYSRSTTLARAMRGDLGNETGFGSSLPNGVLWRGFAQYTEVERALITFRPQMRQTALVEYVLPRSVVGLTIPKRAAFLGISPATHNSRLHRLRERIRELKAVAA